MKNKFKFFLSALLVLLFTMLSTTCFATTGTNLIDQYLNTYGSTRVNFAEAGFKYYYEGYNGTTTWRSWLFSVNEPTIQNGKLYQINGPFYVLNYTPNRGFYDNINYLNNSTNRTLSSINTSSIDTGSGSNSAFNSSYYPNCVNSNISYYNLPLQYYEDLLNPTWNGVFEDGSQKGVINFNEAGYYVYINPLYPGLDYSRFRLVLNLVEFSANGVSQMTKESMSPSYADNIVKLQDNLTSSLENQQIISLESIRKYLKTSKIYRLEYSILAYDENNNLSTSAFCTSEFFSLNSWTSDKIIVRNISEFFGDSAGGIISPSGDISSGDYIINNTINNIGADMNQNFNELNNTISNANGDYWGEDLDQSDFENQLSNSFNGIMDNISGEFSRNQIFDSLQGAENGFLNFFKNQQNEQHYDLQFSWPDISYMGGVLIPAGGFNISQMCRDIPELGRLQTLIRVIFNFGTAVCLIKQIYNLILSTLGIDNPYLYEDYTEVTTINEDGEYRQSAVKRKKKL